MSFPRLASVATRASSARSAFVAPVTSSARFASVAPLALCVILGACAIENRSPDRPSRNGPVA
ncbi:MAG TPA: hypothetical protein PKE51_13745, partial [Gemmatimonadaceae bacterium]|nr:hypothetical protein [Gemmatimonadaceae bacterium]